MKKASSVIWLGECTDVLLTLTGGSAGVYHTPDLVAQDFQSDDPAGTLETASRAAGTTAKEHAQAQYYPCDVVPLGGILVEHARCGDERNHLEQGVTDGVTHRVVVVAQEEINDDCGCRQRQCRVETELGILEQLFGFALKQNGIEQGEAHAREEHEHYRGVVDGSIIEIAGAGVMGGKAACCRHCH